MLPSLSPEGLTALQAAEALRLTGPNELTPSRSRSTLLVFLARLLTDPMVLLLLIAAITYGWLGDKFDAIVVGIALLPIFLVNGILEQRADMALENLRLLASPDAAVVRDGYVQRIKALEVVPGDILALDEGDIVAADGVMLPGGALTIDESTLTGESIPVHITSASAEPRVLAGTRVVAGSGYARVEHTGRLTEYGRIGHLMNNAVPSQAPIEAAIRKLVIQLGAVVLLLCTALALLGITRGNPWPAAIIAAVSLAMAAIPEELPMVYTLYLALGAWRLAKQQALVRRLACVETLGTATVICADKTGTLTYGRIELHQTYPIQGIDTVRLLQNARAASAERVVTAPAI